MGYGKIRHGKEIITASMIIIILTLSAIIISSNPSMTGMAAIQELEQSTIPVEKEYTQATTEKLELERLVSFRVNGEIQGKATIWLNTTQGKLLVYNTTESEKVTTAASPLTGKVTYGNGAEAGEGPPENKTPPQTGRPPQNGLESVAGNDTQNDTVEEDDSLQGPIPINESIGENVTEENETMNITDPVNETTEEPDEETNITLAAKIESECVETCLLQGLSSTSIIIEVHEGKIYVESIVITQEAVQETNIISPIPAVTVEESGTVTLALEEYVETERAAFYDLSSSPGYSYSINGSTAMITGEAPGNWTATLYVYVEERLYQEEFTVLVTMEESVAGNDTQNDTVEEDDSLQGPIPINESIGENVTEENETMNITDPVNETTEEPGNLSGTGNETVDGNVTLTNETIVGCDHPNPNMRPLECLQKNDSYFRPEELLVEDRNARVIGRFTPIGNLLIKGGIIENSDETAASNDYQLGHTNSLGDFVATVWISSKTGDLHLRGSLTEANNNIHATSDLTAISNRRGIVLATINREVGDLTLRGNVVPYRNW